MRFTVIVILMTLGTGILAAQDARFEVASVKRNMQGAPGPGGGPGALGQFTPDGMNYTNFTLAMLMRTAYGVREEWIVGGPAWVRSHRFDIVARAASEVPRDRIPLMLRTLLEERFKLVVVTERRDRAAYVLRLNRADGRLGPDLRRASDDCEARKKATDPIAWIRQLPRPSNGALPSSMDACATTTSIASAFERILDATVIDETGLTGRWDWVVSHAGLSSGTIALPGGRTEERPSIFDAAREQLGLRLERRREPGFYEVLVIQSVEPPTEN